MRITVVILTFLLCLYGYSLANEIKLGYNYKEGTTSVSSFHLEAEGMSHLSYPLTSLIKDPALGYNFEYNHGKSNDKVNRNNWNVFFELKSSITQSLDTFIFTRLLYDSVRKIDLAQEYGAGLKHIIIKSQKASFSISEALVYREDRYSYGDTKADMRLSMRAKAKFAPEGRKFYCIFWYKPSIGTPVKDFIIDAKIGVSTRITDMFWLDFSVRDIYQSIPAKGVENNEISSYTSFHIRF